MGAKGAELDIEDRSKAAQPLRTDAECVHPVIYVDTHFFMLVGRATRQEIGHVEGLVQRFLGEQNGGFRTAARADAQYARRTPAGTQRPDGRDHPVGNVLSGIEYGEARLVFRAAALVHIFGTLALAAAEVGDTETLEGLLAYADRYLNPSWKNGGLFYPRNDDLSSPGYTTALVGNALIGGARICPANGFRDLYTKPWTDAVITRPELREVDFPAVLVREASYPKDGPFLRIRLAPGRSGPERQSIAIARLDLSKPIRIDVDGSLSISIAPGSHTAAAHDIEAHVDTSASVLRVSLTLNRDRLVEFHC
jgi:hypothetical protein